VIGRENIPQYGPVLFSINHANQFVDANLVLCTCGNRKINYLMAEASYNRPIIGHAAWALGTVPVKRAQDDARAGSGRITVRRRGTTAGDDSKTGDDNNLQVDGGEKIVVSGIGTAFTSELAVGDKIRLPNSAFGLRVKDIVDDTQLFVDPVGIPDDYPFTDSSGTVNNDDDDSVAVPYDILKHTPLDVVFSKITERLAAGGAVGVFPEGGSHDRTDLLPLKVGIALMAYYSLDKDGLSVPIVPVGLNYFRAHRWRGRAVVEYGPPIYVDPATLDDFKAGGAKVSFPARMSRRYKRRHFF